jgi:hypothetical protein
MAVITPINAANSTAYFVPLSSTGWELRDVAMKASTAMSDWAAIWVEISSNTTTWNATLMPATNSAGQNFIWILAEKIASTDSDYATAWKLKKVWVATSPLSEAEFKVWAGTFTAVDVNKIVSFHSDSLWLAVDTQWLWAEISWYISSTRGRCRFTVPRTVTA